MMAFDPDKYPKVPPRPFVPWKRLQTSFDFLLPVHMSGAGAGAGEDSRLAGGLVLLLKTRPPPTADEVLLKTRNFRIFPLKRCYRR